MIALPHHYFVPATNYWTKFVPATNTFDQNCDSLSRMTTSQSSMRCGGSGVRGRAGRTGRLRKWRFLQLIAASCTCLQPGRRARWPFFAANFTSCHLLAGICTYSHIIFFLERNFTLKTVRRSPPMSLRSLSQHIFFPNRCTTKSLFWDVLAFFSEFQPIQLVSA